MHSPKTHILEVHRNWVINREQWWRERNRILECVQLPTCRSRSLMFVWLASRRKRARHPARTFCSDDVSNQPTEDTDRDCRRCRPADTQSINQSISYADYRHQVRHPLQLLKSTESQVHLTVYFASIWSCRFSGMLIRMIVWVWETNENHQKTWTWVNIFEKSSLEMAATISSAPSKHSKDRKLRVTRLGSFWINVATSPPLPAESSLIPERSSDVSDWENGHSWMEKNICKSNQFSDYGKVWAHILAHTPWTKTSSSHSLQYQYSNV